jgi:hypothetical protein
MIQISEGTIGLWSVALDGGNWLAHVEKLPDGHVQLLYRFRWYKDDKDFESKDDRNWYRFKTKKPGESPDELVAAVRKIFERLAKGAGHEAWELMRGERTPEELADLMLTMPGITHRVEKTPP